ncbi:Chromosome segregation protein SMC [Giardia duodenalis]|uniref:Chromosome segregation protein SMC n=1 Tax=Giardia intestinalis TaxID=5741 RepID=V6TN79_GIAIN|nr:Chromosome segregation protein SMC [Giardia intestinalis]
MFPLLPRYVRGSQNVTQGISMLYVLKDSKKKSAMGSVSTVQLTPSKRGKNMVAVSTVNDKEWHGRLNEFNYYTYNTYLKSEVDAQIAGVVTETCRYGLPFTFFTPLIVCNNEISNLIVPYEQYFKDLISEVKSVTFTALGLKNGGIVDIGKHITDKNPSKQPVPVSLTFNLAGEIDFSPKLYLTEFRELHKTRSKCTSYTERMSALKNYIIKTDDLTCVILTYMSWVDNASHIYPEGRCEMVHTFVVPIFRDEDKFWKENFRTTYNPYDLDSVQKKFDLESPATAEKVFMAQYVHSGKGYFNDDSQMFMPKTSSKEKPAKVPKATPRGSAQPSDGHGEYSKLTAFQADYNSLLYAPENVLTSDHFKPSTAAEYVLFSTPCASVKVLYKYLYLREALTAAMMILPERFQCSPGTVLAAISFVGHVQYTKCLNHRGYNTMDLVGGQRAMFMAHHLKVDPNFLFNADNSSRAETFELVTESGGSLVVKLERFDNCTLVDETEGIPVFEGDGTFVEDQDDDDKDSVTIEDSIKSKLPAKPVVYATAAPANTGSNNDLIVADLQAQLDAKDKLITVSAENMKAVELENKRLCEEIADLQKKLGIPQTYEGRDHADNTFSEMNPASLSQITSGLGTQRDELLNDIDKEIQDLITMSRRRDNEITALSAQVEHGGDTDSLVKEYLDRNKALEEKLISTEQELGNQKKSLETEREANKKLQRLLDDLKAGDDKGKGGGKSVDEAALQKLRIQYENQMVNLKKENLEKVQALHAEIQRLRSTHEAKMHEAKKHYEEERNKELRSLKRRAEEDFMAKLTEIKLKIKEAFARH